LNDLEKLVAIDDICRVKAAYFRCMDTKNWEGLNDLFTEDALFDVRGALEMPKPEEAYASEAVITGRKAIVTHLSTALAPIYTVHHGNTPEIEILSPTEAKGVWAMSDLLVPKNGKPFRRFQGHGQYHEKYQRQGDRWRISSLVLRRFYVEMEE
jgi:hypothetical protein